MSACARIVEQRGGVVACGDTERLVCVAQRLRHVARIGGRCQLKLRIRERKSIWLTLRIKEPLIVERQSCEGEPRHSTAPTQCAIGASCDRRAAEIVRCVSREKESAQCKLKSVSDEDVEAVRSWAPSLATVMGGVTLDIPEEPDVDGGEEAAVSDAVAESMLRLDIPEEPDVNSTQEEPADNLASSALPSDAIGCAAAIRTVALANRSSERLARNAGRSAHILNPHRELPHGTQVALCKRDYVEPSQLSGDASNLAPSQHHSVHSAQLLKGKSCELSQRGSYQSLQAPLCGLEIREGVSTESSLHSAVRSCEGADASNVNSPFGPHPRFPVRLRVRTPKHIPLRLPVRTPPFKRGRNTLQSSRAHGGGLESDGRVEPETSHDVVQESFCERGCKRMRTGRDVRDSDHHKVTENDYKGPTIVDERSTSDLHADYTRDRQSPAAGQGHNLKETAASIPLHLRLREHAKRCLSLDSSSSLRLPFDDLEFEPLGSNCKPSSAKVASDGRCSGAMDTAGLSSCDITPRNLAKIFGGTDSINSPCMKEDDDHSYSPTILDSGSARGSAGKHSADCFGRAEGGPPAITVPTAKCEAGTGTCGVDDHQNKVDQKTQYAVCLSGMGKDSTEIILAEELLSLRGTELSDGFDSEPGPSCVLTIFDEKRNIERPRMVVLEAMAHRIPIVSLDWLIASYRVGFLVDTEPFEAVSNHRRKGPGVFEKIVATLDHSFDQPAAEHMVRRAGKDIRRLLRAGGAYVVNHEQLATSLHRKDTVTLHIHVVNDFGDEGSNSPGVSAEDMEQLRVAQRKIPTKVVNMAWVSDSLCSGQCPPPCVDRSDGESVASIPTALESP